MPCQPSPFALLFLFLNIVDCRFVPDYSQRLVLIRLRDRLVRAQLVSCYWRGGIRFVGRQRLRKSDCICAAHIVVASASASIPSASIWTARRWSARSDFCWTPEIGFGLRGHVDVVWLRKRDLVPHVPVFLSVGA